MELPVLVGVGFYGCPNAYTVFIIFIYILALWKNIPTSDYAADATTCLSDFH